MTTGLTRLKTSRKDRILLLVLNGRHISLNRQELDNHNTPGRAKAEIDRKLGRASDLSIHFNRDGSVAIAWGQPPLTWPEDEV